MKLQGQSLTGPKVLSRLDREEILKRVRLFTRQVLQRIQGICCVIVIGSVAHGNHGPRSDVDIVVVLDRVDDRIYALLKKLAVDTIGLPIDLILITVEQLGQHMTAATRFYQELQKGVWIHVDPRCVEQTP